MSSSCASLAARDFFTTPSASVAAVALALFVVLGFLAVLAPLVDLVFFREDGFVASTLSAFLVIEVSSSSDWLGSCSAMPPEQTRSMTLANLSLAPALVDILLVGSLVLDMLTADDGQRRPQEMVVEFKWRLRSPSFNKLIFLFEIAAIFSLSPPFSSGPMQLVRAFIILPGPLPPRKDDIVQ